MAVATKPLDRPTSRGALALAAATMLVFKMFVPFGREILYPLTLMATWVHEMGHGLSALVMGGRFDSLQIFADASGLAWSTSQSGWREAVHSAGGLMAPPIVGAVVLAVSRGPRRARIVLSVLALAMIASLPIWVRTLVGWIAIPIVALVVGAFAWVGGERERMVMAQFIGLALASDTVTRIDYLFVSSAEIAGERRPSDIARVADALGGPRLAWGALLAAFSLACVAIGMRAAWWRRAERIPARGAVR